MKESKMTLCCRNIAAIACLVIVPILANCRPPPIRSPQQVSGEYIFRYKTGEVEVLILSADLTYQHDLYTNLLSYQNVGTSKYSNNGTWSPGRNEVKMDHFLLFCEYPNPEKVLDSPRTINSMSGFWQAPSRHQEATIWLNEAFEYVFLRVKNRMDVK